MADCTARQPAEVARIRWRHLSYIMQGSMNVLNPVRRLRQSFVDFARPHIDGTEQRIRGRPSIGHLARVKLDASVLAAYPHELSGGMRQRATIALATICRPDFIIADEPTTALDVVVQKDVLGMIRGIQREIGSSVLFVTHDMGVHAHLTDRLGIMYAGRLVEEAATAEMFRNPLHPYTRHLISSLPRIGDDVPRKGLEGAPPNLADPPPGCRFHPRCPLAMEVCSQRVRRHGRNRAGASRRLLRRQRERRSHERSAARRFACQQDLHPGRAVLEPADRRRQRRQLPDRRGAAGDLHHHRRIRQRQDHAVADDPEHRAADQRRAGVRRRRSGDGAKHAPTAWPSCTRCSRSSRIRSRPSIR